MNSQAPPKVRIPDIIVEGEPIAGPPAPIRHDLTYLESLAQWAAASQLWGLTRAQAVALMCLAESRGIPAIEAVVRFHIIDGKPSMSAAAMQAEFQRHGGRIQIEVHTSEECRIEVWHLDKHPKHVTFSVTLKELVDSHVACVWDTKQSKWKTKPTYLKHPRQMLHARCISEAIRTIDPGTNLGVYTKEEIWDWDYSGEARGRPWARAAAGPETHVPASSSPGARGDAEALLREAGTAADRTPVRPQVGGPRDEEPDPAIVEVKAFIRAAIAEATNRVKHRLALEKGPESADIDDVCNGHQLVNHLVTLWVEDGTVDPIEVSGPEGKRSREKAIRAVAWAYGRIPDEVREDVREYLAAKEEQALRGYGLATEDSPGEGAPGPEAEGEMT